MSARSRAHGRRDTNTYPLTPKTTGSMINIPNRVLIIVLSILPCRRSRLPIPGWIGGGRDDSGLNDYVGSVAPPPPSASG